MSRKRRSRIYRNPEEFREIREMVKKVLNRYPWLYDVSDNVLVWLVWKIYARDKLGINLPFIPSDVLNKLPQASTIIRRRTELFKRVEV